MTVESIQLTRAVDLFTTSCDEMVSQKYHAGLTAHYTLYNMRTTFKERTLFT